VPCFFGAAYAAMWVKIKNQTLETLLQSIYCPVAFPKLFILHWTALHFLLSEAFDTHLSAFILLEVGPCERIWRSMSTILKKVWSGHCHNGTSSLQMKNVLGTSI